MAEPRATGAASATLAFIAVGTSFAAAEQLTAYPAAGGQAVRYALAALVLFGLFRGRVTRPARGDLVRLVALAAIGLAGFNLLMLAAVAKTDAGSVGVVVGCLPVVLALASPLLGRGRPAPVLVLCGCVVAAGAGVVQQGGGGMSSGGLLLALGALACEAGFTLLAAPLLPRLGAVAVSAWAALLAAGLLAAYGLVADGPAGVIDVPTAPEASALLFMAIVTTALAFVLFYTAVARLGPQQAGLFAGLVPISALLTAALLGASELTFTRLIGAAAVTAGIVVGVSVTGSSSAAPRALKLRGPARLRLDV